MFPPKHLDNDTIEDADCRHGKSLYAGDVHYLEKIPVSHQEIMTRYSEFVAKKVSWLRCGYEGYGWRGTPILLAKKREMLVARQIWPDRFRTAPGRGRTPNGEPASPVRDTFRR